MKIRNVKGFPEFLPKDKILENEWLGKIRGTFESHGFLPIETPAVESIDLLASKGEIDKEIFVVSRYQADGEEKKEFALHYDLTMPLSRYVSQYYGQISMPFKRYQMQKVWRGERPQEGRYREFYQCDIDIICEGKMPGFFVREVTSTVAQTLGSLLPIPFTLNLSNRKILEGYLKGIGVGDFIPVVRTLDKIDKIGKENVQKHLVDELGIESSIASRCTALAEIQADGLGFIEPLKSLGVTHETLDDGIAELTGLVEGLTLDGIKNCSVNLSIARGFDYYTGNVVEVTLDQFPKFGTIASGGQYDDLCGKRINKQLPGFGMSIGLSRLFTKMLKENVVNSNNSAVAKVLVIVPSEGQMEEAVSAARGLRNNGVQAEVYGVAAKLKKQMAYADKLSIPYVWFPPFDADGKHEVKNMVTGEQQEADPTKWTP